MVLDYFTFERLVSSLCEGLVLFHFKGKTGHKLLRNFMALSKAQIGSQGKIKPQLLSGKSNGKERLLPARGVEEVGLPARVVGEEALRWATDTHLMLPWRILGSSG